MNKKETHYQNLGQKPNREFKEKIKFGEEFYTKKQYENLSKGVFTSFVIGMIIGILVTLIF